MTTSESRLEEAAQVACFSVYCDRADRPDAAERTSPRNLVSAGSLILRRKEVDALPAILRPERRTFVSTPSAGLTCVANIYALLTSTGVFHD